MAKNAKTSKVSNKTIDSGNEMGKFILMVTIVTLLFIAFYGITILITNKKTTTPTNSSTGGAKIQYSKILIGNLLTQPEEKYYVLIGDQDDDSINLYDTYLKLYESTKDSSKVYRAILNHPMNTRFKGEETVTNIKDILELKVKGTTLVYVEKGKITKAYDNEEDLLKILKELAQIKEEKTEE